MFQFTAYGKILTHLMKISEYLANKDEYKYFKIFLIYSYHIITCSSSYGHLFLALSTSSMASGHY